MSIFYQTHKEHLRLYISTDITFAAHLHNQVELLMVLKGSLLLTIDHTVHTLSAGMHALIFPNQLHSLQTPTSSQILLCIFDGDFCHSYRKYFQNSIPVCNIQAMNELSSHSQTALEGLLLLTENSPRGTGLSPATSALAEGYLTLFLADALPRMELQPRTLSEDLDLEQKLLIYLETHYTEPLSLESLSREFGVSRFVLSRLFTDKLHTTFSYYVNSKRLEYACSLLLSTNLSITRIALDAGFGSSRTFFREFSRTYHTTPKEYRRKHPYP